MPGFGRKPEKERQTDTNKKEQCLTNTGREMTHRFQLSIPRTDEAHAHLSEGLRYPRAGGEKENRGALSDTLSYSLPVRQTFPYLTPTFMVKIFFLAFALYGYSRTRFTLNHSECDGLTDI